MKLAIITFIASVELASAQPENLVIKEPYKSLWRFDNNSLYEIVSKKKKMHLNGKAIDSTGVSLNTIVVGQNIILGYEFKEKSGYNFYTVNLDGKIDFLNKITDQVRTTNAKYFVSEIKNHKINGEILSYTDRNFYTLDLKTAKPREYIHLDKVTKFDSLDGRELCMLYELSNDKLLATTCDCYGECLMFEYFLVDLKSKQMEKVNLNWREPHSDVYRGAIKDCDDRYILIAFFGAEKPENNGWFIYDYDFKEISPALDREINAIGGNYRNRKYTSTNVRSELDDGNAVIITYKFSMPLERSMYRIHAGLPLLQEDVKLCIKNQRDLLRNMVFAKYNYKFDSEYYQAYFSLYSFYDSDEARKGRVKDVSKLLTSVDKSNLTMIGK